MKNTLYLKFIWLYVIFGFLSLFTTSILGRQLILTQAKEATAQRLYREANLISTNYLPSHFNGNTSTWAVHAQLNAMQIYLDSSQWWKGS